MSKIITLAPKRPARMSQKVRAALEAMVTEGRNITQAAEAAGMSRNGLHKALKRPEVQDFLEDRRKRFIADMDGKRALYKAQALEVALDLMMNAKSESIRARMAEFLASDAKVSPVSVNIDARSVQPVGYQYRRPGEGQAVPEIGEPEDG
jgi:hypothetical protein